jgi:hypothetical protein
VLFGFDSVALHQVCFAEVLVRAAVPRIERQRLLVMSHRRIKLPQTAIGVSEIVLNIGIAVIAQPCGRKRLDGAVPVAGDDCALAVGEIWIERRPICALPIDEQIGQASTGIATSTAALGAPGGPAAGSCRAGAVKR